MSDYDAFGNTDRPQSLIPWLVTGAVAVIAVAAAVVFVMLVQNGKQAEVSPAPSPTSSASQPQTPAPTPSAPSDDSEPEETPAKDQAPTVEVGNTSTMVIGPFGVSVEVPGDLGSTNWSMPGTDTALLESALQATFPESCSALRTGWGIKQSPGTGSGTVVDGKSYSLVRPGESCAADPELYDRVWGLNQYVVDSVKKG